MGNAIAAAFLLSGSLLCLLAGIGLHRFADVFARMHVATKPATLGLVLVMTGVAIRLADGGDIAKLALVVAIQFVTAPTGAHLLARAAYRSGNELSASTVLDELGRGELDDLSSPS